MSKNSKRFSFLKSQSEKVLKLPQNILKIKRVRIILSLSEADLYLIFSNNCCSFFQSFCQKSLEYFF